MSYTPVTPPRRWRWRRSRVPWRGACAAVIAAVLAGWYATATPAGWWQVLAAGLAYWLLLGAALAPGRRRKGQL